MDLDVDLTRQQQQFRQPESTLVLSHGAYVTYYPLQRRKSWRRWPMIERLDLQIQTMFSVSQAWC